jgi:TPP-dependent pyruvate/acetoin dehydrogenase alpha subunit
VERARSGEGPTLIVADTYRIEGHTIGDPLTLRPKDETETWRKRDPILRLRQTLKAQGVLDDAAEMIAAEAEREIDAAVEFALNSLDPEIAELWKDVY